MLVVVLLLRVMFLTLMLVLLLLGAPYLFIAHGTLLWSVSYVAYLAAMTGGINSPVLVWMTAAVLPAILLLDRMSAFFWVGVVFAANLMLLLISQQGLVNSDINMANDVMAWTVANKFFVLSLAMFVVFVTERMHRSQVANMDQSNAELEQTHQALLRAQAHKDEFIASVGHELRTPMNAILGLNGILRTELAAREEDAQVVDHIRRVDRTGAARDRLEIVPPRREHDIGVGREDAGRVRARHRAGEAQEALRSERAGRVVDAVENEGEADRGQPRASAARDGPPDQEGNPHADSNWRRG